MSRTEQTPIRHSKGDQPLFGQVALITGASRGIGRAIGLRLAKLGANIVLNYVHNEEAARDTQKAFEAEGIQVLPYRANVGDPEASREMVDVTLDAFGRIDILVHNAAMGAFKPVHRLKTNQWDLSMNINSRALLLLTQKVIPSMEKQGHGNIIAISSLGARRYIPNYGAIGISKAAVETLVRYLAVELMPKGIRVNGVTGGLVDTDAIKWFPQYETFKKEIIHKTPAGRIANPDDLARVVAFLAVEESSWIVGQTIAVDGGLSLI